MNVRRSFCRLEKVLNTMMKQIIVRKLFMIIIMVQIYMHPLIIGIYAECGHVTTKPRIHAYVRSQVSCYMRFKTFAHFSSISPHEVRVILLLNHFKSIFLIKLMQAMGSNAQVSLAIYVHKCIPSLKLS